MARVPLACTVCETIAPPKTSVRGSFLVELGLWLLFILPGLIYSLWRLTGKAMVCIACGSTALVPLHSPAGQRIVEKAQAGSRKE